MKVLNYLLLFSYCLYIIFPVMILLHSAIKMMISTPTLLVFNKDKLTLSSPIKIFYLRWLNFNLLMLFLVCRISCVLVDFWSRSKISYCWKKVMIILLISSYLSHNIWEEVQVKLKFTFVQWITWLLCNKTFVTQAVRRKKKAVLGITAAPVANTSAVFSAEMYVLFTQWWESHPGPYWVLLLVSWLWGRWIFVTAPSVSC